VLGSVTCLAVDLPAGGEASHSITYAPAAAGSVTVTVTAVLKFADGTDVKYTYDISYEVRDAGKLVYIGVDASHFNEYVDGNYKDSMANFAALAADYGVRVNVLWTGAELIAACANAKYKAIILTAPSRRVDPEQVNPTTGGPYTHRTYSQEELAAIAGFSHNGGTLVLTGWGNLYESYKYTSAMQLDEHMSSQQNKVLAAIGATLRLSDDASSDIKSNPNEEWRMYLTDTLGCYNWDSALLGGAQTSQIFSQYGGSTLYTVSPSDKSAWDAAPSASVPASVTPAVVLSDGGKSVNRETLTPGTNYRTDYTLYGGRHMVLASEALPNGNGGSSLVVVAGGAFMSNFEVKVEMDNASTPQYSNYNIALNIIKAIAPEETAMGIADAKALPEGTKVTVEGIATSNVYSGDNASNTGFFDCIYIQDGTGGVNLFPVASGVLEGQRVRVTGTVSAYQGETQILVTGFEVIDGSINSIKPTEMSTEDAMAPGNTGLLVTVCGVVSDIYMTGDTVSQFTVTDASGAGEIVYINSYITSDTDLSFVVEGATVSVTGLDSIGENLSSSDFQPRIRVRDRSEIEATTVPEGTEYTVTVEGSYADESGAGSYAQGGTVTIDAGSRAGYLFTGWTVPGGSAELNDASLAVTTFTMPEGDVTVTANWRHLANKPGAGTDAGDGQQSPETENPDAPGTPDIGMAFDDVNANDWFYEDVLFVYGSGLMQGGSDSVFGPDIQLSRAMIVTILYRLAGGPDTDMANLGFTDVKPGDWYAEAVAWAAANDIVKGYGDGRFAPMDPITRQDLAVTIMRYMDSLGVVVPVTAQYIFFADEADIGEYAAGAIQTLNILDIIRGTGVGMNGQTVIDPKGTATRAQAATIIHRLVTLIELTEAAQ